MSPDNYVQDPYNTQNFNRFGYVLNNPLLYTDPSGEFIPLLLGAIGVSILTKAISNLINGIPWWHGLGKAATMGAINAVISFGIGDIASSAFSNYWSQAALKAGLHALKSGTLSAIEGGNFGSGFLSGAIASMARSTVGKLGINTANPIVQGNKTIFVANNFGNTAEFKAIMLATGATAGGISSSLAGGDFWLGVREGLISGGCNELMHVVFDAFEQQQANTIEERLRNKISSMKLGDKIEGKDLKLLDKKASFAIKSIEKTSETVYKVNPTWFGNEMGISDDAYLVIEPNKSIEGLYKYKNQEHPKHTKINGIRIQTFNMPEMEVLGVKFNDYVISGNFGYFKFNSKTIKSWKIGD